MRRLSFDTRSLTIAGLLQEWDVIGVYSDADNRPIDDEEYDDLVQPLRDWLEAGASPEEISIRLVGTLRRDYGLPYDDDLAELTFARTLHAGWNRPADRG